MGRFKNIRTEMATKAPEPTPVVEASPPQAQAPAVEDTRETRALPADPQVPKPAPPAPVTKPSRISHRVSVTIPDAPVMPEPELAPDMPDSAEGFSPPPDVVAAQKRAEREAKRALIRKSPVGKVIEAANSPVLRQRAQTLLDEGGMGYVMKKLYDARELTADKLVSARAQYLLNQDIPNSDTRTDAGDSERALAARKQALQDVALVRTVGVWTPGMGNLYGKPGALGEVITPGAEVLGVDRDGNLVFAEKSAGDYAGDVLASGAKYAVATGLPDTAFRAVFGEAKDASELPAIDLTPSVGRLRQGRSFTDVAHDTDPEAAVVARMGGKYAAAEYPTLTSALQKTALAADTVLAAGGDVLTPDPVSVGVGGILKGAKAVGSATKLSRLAGETERAEKAVASLDRLAAGARDARVALEGAEGAEDVAKAIHESAQAVGGGVRDVERIAPAAARAASRAAAAGGREALVLSKEAEAAAQTASAGEDAARAAGSIPQVGKTEEVLRWLGQQAREATDLGKLERIKGAATEILFSTTRGAETLSQIGRAGLEAEKAARTARTVPGAAIHILKSLDAETLAGNKALRDARALVEKAEAAESQLSRWQQVKDAPDRALGAVSKEFRTELWDRLTTRMERQESAVKAAYEKATKTVLDEAKAGRLTLSAAERGKLGESIAGNIEQSTTHIPGGESAVEKDYLRGLVLEGGEMSAHDIARLDRDVGEVVSKSQGGWRDIMSAYKQSPPLPRILRRVLDAWPVRTSVRAGKAVFWGANELADWSRAGLSADARKLALEETRVLEAVGSDVTKLDGAHFSAYLEGAPLVGADDLPFAGSGTDRFSVFKRYVDKAQAAETFLDMLVSQGAKAALGEKAYDGVLRECVAAMSSATTADELLEEATKIRELVAGKGVRGVVDDLRSQRAMTSVAAVEAQMIVAATRVYGDGIAIDKETFEAMNAFGSGAPITGAHPWFDADASKASLLALRTERFVAPGRLLGAEGLVMKTLNGQVYVPTLVREKLAEAATRAYSPPSTAGKGLMSMWKLAVTKGAIVNKPGYFLNNLAGDTEQAYIAFGTNTALRTFCKNALLQLVVAGGSAGKGLGVVGELVVAPTVSALAGTEKGKLIVSRLAEAAQQGGEAISRLLSAGSYRVEVSKILEGGDEVIQVGDRAYTAQALREAAVRGGVWESNVAVLAEDSKSWLAQQAQVFRMPAEGAQHIAETVSLRQRLGLYTTLLEQGMTPAEAADGVVKALYDYRHSLTEAERTGFVGWLLPFWSFQKNSNRQMLGALASPVGAYRLHKFLAAQKVGIGTLQDLSAWYNSDGDDTGILVQRFPGTEDDALHKAYAHFQAFRERVDPEGAVSPQQWNMLILSGSPGKEDPALTAFLSAAMDAGEDVDALRSDLSFLRDWTVPLYNDRFAKLYTHRDSISLGPRTYEGTDILDPHTLTHVLAPPSAAEDSVSWALKGIAMSLAIPNALMSPNVTASDTAQLASGMVDPTRAPLIGQGLRSLTGRGSRSQLPSWLGEALIKQVPGAIVSNVREHPNAPAGTRKDVTYSFRDPIAEFAVSSNPIGAALLSVKDETSGGVYDDPAGAQLLRALGFTVRSTSPEGVPFSEYDFIKAREDTLPQDTDVAPGAVQYKVP